jgi:gas vesicle protein
MSDQSASSGSFVKAFIPGLVVGFVVGAAVGVIVATTGGNVSKLNTSNSSVDRPASTDADRDGYPDEVIDEAAQAGEELIDDAQEAVEDAADDLQENIEDQIPETDGDG